MIHARKEKDFISLFDDKTGMYIRSGLMKDGKEIRKDPFMASFPELLDVGIMGHCTHGSKGLCVQAGVECYQDGLHSNRPNMSLDDFRKIVRECKGKVYQIALGGCGDPDEHKDFESILKLCRENGIVPNFTTSGVCMTKYKADLCAKYCGAVAVSWYRSQYTEKAIHMLTVSGVKTNIHYVIADNTIDEAIDRLRNHGFPEGINAIIFLLHKPIGLGSKKNMIHIKDERFLKFIEIIDHESFPYKIGFDSCTVPALINITVEIDSDSLDTCEGARWSAYISSDMKMMPCSFDNQALKWAVDLRKNTIQEAWFSREFEAFRDHFRQSCPECPKRTACLGGCPICPEIVLCDAVS